jgi:hypothetical protein
MADVNGINGSKDDQLMSELETAVRKILKANKVSKADKLAGINAGIRLLAIKHRIQGGGPEDSENFFK